ncbi:hypothetical protein BC827DRAFT_1209986 [Russula dissimulans]|nr:hypothetical protein BC827DRAFT_1209986 [Russula dissimulans]
MTRMILVLRIGLPPPCFLQLWATEYNDHGPICSKNVIPTRPTRSHFHLHPHSKINETPQHHRSRPLHTLNC